MMTGPATTRIEHCQTPEEQHHSNLKAEYQEVCNNFRTLTDIRFKLLAFLPIGTAAGIALVERGEPNEVSEPSGLLIGLFGLVVTCSIALYNMRNDQLYYALATRAAELERDMGIRDGAFANSPPVWRRVILFRVSHSQIWWIYWSSLIAWVFTILYGIGGMASYLPKFFGLICQILPQIDCNTKIALVVATAIVSFLFIFVWLQGKGTDRRLKRSAKEAVEE